MLLTSASNESMADVQVGAMKALFKVAASQGLEGSPRGDKNHLPVTTGDPLGDANRTFKTPEKNASEDEDHKPFFIMDFLEQVDPAAMELAQKVLKTPQKTTTHDTKKPEGSRGVCKDEVTKDLFSTVSGAPTSVFFQRSIATGNGYNAKGIQKARQGDWEDALACWESALEIRMQVLGASHIDTANCCNNIGIAYGKLNLFDQAVAFLERALEIRKEHYGSEHPEVAATLHNLGNIYQQEGNYEAAIEYFLQCKSLQEAMLGGSDHIEIARACIAIGHTYYQAEVFDDARAAYMDALYIFHRVGLNEHDPEVQAALKDVQDLDLTIHVTQAVK
jgi:Tetratricopeptide repeat